MNTTTVSASPASPTIACPVGDLIGEPHDFDPTTGTVTPWLGGILGDSRKAVIVCPACSRTGDDNPRPTMDDYLNESDWNWHGFGFLGEYRNARMDGVISEEHINTVLATVYAFAEVADWSNEELFEWLDSRRGRHFGEQAFFGYDNPGNVSRQTVILNLLQIVPMYCWVA